MPKNINKNNSIRYELKLRLIYEACKIRNVIRDKNEKVNKHHSRIY